MTILDPPGQSERHVRQKVFADFNLIAMTRIFINRGEQNLNAERPKGESSMQVKV